MNVAQAFFEVLVTPRSFCT